MSNPKDAFVRLTGYHRVVGLDGKDHGRSLLIKPHLIVEIRDFGDYRQLSIEDPSPYDQYRSLSFRMVQETERTILLRMKKAMQLNTTQPTHPPCPWVSMTS